MILSNNKSFSVEYNARLPGVINGKPCYVASLDGKIKTAKIACPQCGRSSYANNGYHRVEDSVIRSLNLSIKIAQFACTRCRFRWSTERELVDEFIRKEKEFLKSLLLGCARSGLSFEHSSAIAEETIGRSYSPQYVHELYVNALDRVKHERQTSASGVYYYDEQFLHENGDEVCRLAIRDAVTGKVILDTRTTDAKRKTITRTLRTGLDGLPVDAFIVDMKQGYPEIIRCLYPAAKIQWCIFHLYKLIWKELTDEFDKNPPLQQLYNAYLLFDIFFDHTPELRKLEELLKKFDRYKFNNQKLDREVENGLRREFRLFVKELKKQRRREEQNVPRRTLKQSESIFTSIKQQAAFFPKKLQSRIRFIDENWERFTLFQRDSRVQPTNNGLEQYFGATLSKTDKKDFRSPSAVTRELRACQAEWNGQKLFSKATLVEVLSLAGLLFLAFSPG